jgi:hypothetical protein
MREYDDLQRYVIVPGIIDGWKVRLICTMVQLNNNDNENDDEYNEYDNDEAVLLGIVAVVVVVKVQCESHHHVDYCLCFSAVS